MIAQLIYIALTLIGLGMAFAKHGEEEKKKYNGWVSLFATIIIWTILWWGGFWDPLMN